ncbi:hypothetical protein [Aquirhabdus sp.]|uniref:hypothetical protein n=1 Tax=Aquirhabdus sp. TaxID=2824160 RepID=UPI00396C7377
MKLLKLLVLTTTCIWLSSCAVYTPAGSVVVDPHSGYGHGDRDRDRGDGGGRDFCPPGQAKKGNC